MRRRGLTFLLLFIGSSFVLADNEAGCTFGTGELRVCPGTLFRSTTAVFRLGEHHPSSMAVRQPDGNWVYVVYPDIDYSWFSDFEHSAEVSFKVDELRGLKAVNGDLKEVRVFEAPGDYLIYLADNLETERDGTYWQEVTVTLE